MKVLKHILFFILIFFATLIAHSKDYSVCCGTEFDILKKDKVEADTSVTNKILQVWATSTDLNVKVQVSDKNKQINITVYNMLGKEIVKVYDGLHARESDPYTVSFYIPNGIYICVLRGDGFRHAEKFIISR